MQKDKKKNFSREKNARSLALFLSLRRSSGRGNFKTWSARCKACLLKKCKNEIMSYKELYFLYNFYIYESVSFLAAAYLRFSLENLSHIIGHAGLTGRPNAYKRNNKIDRFWTP